MALVSLKPTQKGVTVMAIVVAAMFVFCLLACFGTVAKVQAIDGQRAKVEKQVKESESIAQTQRDAENRYIDTRAQIRFLESSVATQAYVPTLLKQIERLGKSVDLKVIGVRPKANDSARLKAKVERTEGEKTASADGSAAAPKPEPPKPYDELSIDLQLEGDYMNALDFLYRLTSFPKIVAVNAVQMSPSGLIGVVGSPKLTIDINVTAFVFKETKATARKTTDAAKVPGRTGNEAG